VALLTAAVMAMTAGCSSHHAVAVAPAVAPQGPQQGRPDPQRFLSVSPAAKAVRLTMLAALGSSNNGYNFDGYGRGELIASVPRGWRVTVQFQNRGPRRASAAVVTGARSATLAFPGAAVPDPVQGIAPGGTSQFSFAAGHTGVFRIASLVPGQAEARMYAVLVVTGGGRPSITARPGP
jgi:hypothetical protein